uniref:Calmodulin n=1 Tax=Magallana gigas TaxID=29159 RepID=K1PXE2_MAGGI|eukprot:XP_019923550.1 PREDICTED: uncharacterized protein LOC105330043 [Crassostrea gigas]
MQFQAVLAVLFLASFTVAVPPSKSTKGCRGFLWTSCDKKVAFNRLSCSLSDYDVNGDGSVKVPEFLTTISATQEVREELSSLIDKDNDGMFSEREFTESLPELRSRDIVNC